MERHIFQILVLIFPFFFWSRYHKLHNYVLLGCPAFMRVYLADQVMTYFLITLTGGLMIQLFRWSFLRSWILIVLPLHNNSQMKYPHSGLRSYVQHVPGFKAVIFPALTVWLVFFLSFSVCLVVCLVLVQSLPLTPSGLHKIFGPWCNPSSLLV